MIRGFVKAAIAKKILDEARKPQNQARAKALFDQLRNKRQPR